MNRTLASELDTKSAGRALGALLEPGDLVALSGDLGAGKTSLCKAAIAALCGVDEDGLGLCWPLYWNQQRAQPPG